MTLRIGINGLGRIGRCVIRALVETARTDIELVAANGPAAIDTHVHLLRWDSVHGRFPGDVQARGENLLIDGRDVILMHEKDPSRIPWKSLGVDMVLECSGKFNSKAQAQAHMAGGARKVLISAPADGVDATIVYGVNHETLRAEHEVISVGSCTTNCLAPMAKAINDAVGIEVGFMTTIHAYTGDQNLVDGSHKDLRRARSAALSMIPTSTGAAKALGLVLPELAGKLDGIAIRVPVPNVSLVDLTFTANRATSKEELNEVFRQAAKGPMRGVLSICNEPLVSIDYTHSPYSSTADLSATHVMNGRFCRVASWYDNEWGFACRMLDVASAWAFL